MCCLFAGCRGGGVQQLQLSAALVRTCISVSPHWVSVSSRVRAALLGCVMHHFEETQLLVALVLQ